MKNKLTNMLVILSSILFIRANAQHINYTYDANGNRILRQYSPTRLINTTTPDPEADKTAAQYGIGVYPNPLMDGNNVTVVVKSLQDKTEEISAAAVYVMDNTGKVLFSQQQNTASPVQLDLSNYSAGIYHIKVVIGKEELFYKVTKTK